MKTLDVDTFGLITEEQTLKSALRSYKEKNEQVIKELKRVYGKRFIPNIHINMAAVKNCKSLLKKLT